ncbi:hypothetical protein SAMN05444392_10774 [Seinonella peptonophila]|uniref:Uncharacterized protein n=1 Tax=Seinonella peptonophila TaxID=112248 RepID=A0A1M4YPV9_9BACL|nr:hypothetical protein [Seinonella peptonophila]SHF07698.1 hypothetical protein SAMN05444392_10774 [Seinonella peptonophila]
MKRFTLMEMFPAFSNPQELDHRQIELLQLCAQIGVPFPAERNKSYGTWWHSLHEIGHWAVKPDWYIQYSSYLLDDLATTWGVLKIPAGTVKGIDYPIMLPKIGRYVGGNDVIPEIGMYNKTDPTPGEHETRVWALQYLELKGWNHPFDDNTKKITTGDEFFHKPASARVWATPQINDPEICTKMAWWGLNVPEGQFRPAEDEEFVLPYPTPVNHQEMVANMDAITSHYGGKVLKSDERSYWLAYLRRRWPEKDLVKRYLRIAKAA